MTAKPELLAPAGSWEAFFAGLEAGADAFYAGLSPWSARGRAADFDLDEMRQLIGCAHGEGRRVYVALDTLLKEDEVPSVLDVVWELGCAGADALILQDLGLWRVCRHVYPELSLHASTQMSVHNAAGVATLRSMGFARAVLARECTIPEIAAIARQEPLPLEVFVHGALCYSISGQCLASSVLTGRSANRGWCAQPCRWDYAEEGAERRRHPLSPTDLNLIERVWDLAEAGATALKIEGRRKGAAWVHTVVRAYRKVLDAPQEGRAAAAGAAREILREAAGRPASEGYAYHPRPREVLRRGGKPEFGTEVGRVLRWKDRVAVVQSGEPLRRGDQLRLVPAGGGAGVALSLRRFQVMGRKGPHHQYGIPCDTRVARNDTVYRVADARGEELEQRLAGRRRELPAPAVPLRLEVGFEGERMVLLARAPCAAAELRVTLPMHAAERRPLDHRTLHKHLGKLGDTRYRLEKLSLRGTLPPVVIPPSEFKGVRRELVAALERTAAAEGQRRRERALELRRPPRSGAGAGKADKRLWIRVEATPALKVAQEQPYHRLVVAMSRDCLRSRDRMLQVVGSRERVVWELPPWIAEGDLDLYRRQVETLVQEGFRDFWLTNLGHLELLAGRGCRLHGGRELNVLNGWGAAALAELGLSSWCPAAEAGGGDLASVAAAGWPLPPVVYTFGSLPLFTTRLDPEDVWPRDTTLVAASDLRLRWAPAPQPLGQPWARVFSDAPLSWTQHMAALAEAGCTDFLFDFAGRPYTRHEMTIILKKFRTQRPLKDTVEGNYSRGLL